jgi:hypothetical protein
MTKISYSEKMKILSDNFSLRNLDKKIFKSSKWHGVYSKRTIQGTKRLTRANKYRITYYFNRLNLKLKHIYLYMNKNVFAKINNSQSIFKGSLNNEFAVLKNMKQPNNRYYFMGIGAYRLDEEAMESDYIYLQYGFQSLNEFDYQISEQINDIINNSRITRVEFFIFDSQIKKDIEFKDIEKLKGD